MTSDAFGGPRDRSVRAGDKERDAIGEILRKRHVEGRLDYDELQARLERAMAARTYAELDELIADLPDAAERRRAEQVSRLGPRLLPFRFLPIAFLALPLVAPVAEPAATAAEPVVVVLLLALRTIAPIPKLRLRRQQQRKRDNRCGGGHICAAYIGQTHDHLPMVRTTTRARTAPFGA